MDYNSLAFFVGMVLGSIAGLCLFLYLLPWIDDFIFVYQQWRRNRK